MSTCHTEMYYELVMKYFERYDWQLSHPEQFDTFSRCLRGF